ncbi:hypothetical protein [Methylomonas koyamae]|uniref:hypothetical protein n=1 Tax=Methylomonas koyamae TaxID=702114 RepID=UPI0006D219B2|nr:hypothetical protein [Methylomonas koyamae]BBL56411.1 hypothetical protein MKFW12EY_00240 [Methylomonas koyamae]
MTRIIDNASASDARVLALDPCPWSERFLTSEKNNVIFDWFAAWRTGDEGLFYTALAGKPDTNELVVSANAVSALAFLCGSIQTENRLAAVFPTEYCHAAVLRLAS